MYCDPEGIVGKVKDGWKTVKSYFSKDKTAEYRSRAMICFLPKWEGFLVNKAAEQMNVKDAISELQNVVKCMSRVWIEESGDYREESPNNFDAQKVIYFVAALTSRKVLC